MTETYYARKEGVGEQAIGDNWERGTNPRSVPIGSLKRSELDGP